MKKKQDMGIKHPSLKKITASQVLNALAPNIAVLDSDGKIIAVNTSWKTFAIENNSPGNTDYIGTNYLQVCDTAIKKDEDKIAQIARQGILSVLNGDVERFSLEYPCHSPSEKRWFSMLTTRFIEDGIVYLLVSHENITARKLAEYQQQEASKQLQLIFTHSMDAILLTAPDGRIISANPAAEEMFGRSENELKSLGRSGVLDLSDPRLLDGLKQRSTTGYFSGELTGVRSDGSKFPIELSTAIFKNIDGDLRTSMIIRDITQRKLIDDQMAYHSSILENVNDVIIGTDKNFLISYWNKAAQKIFGWKPEEVMGKTATSILHTEFFNDDFEQSVKTLKETGTWRGEVIQYRKDNQPVIIDANIMTIRDHAGQVTGHVSANRDITSQKQAQEKLVEAYKALEHKNHELAQVLERERVLARTDSLTGVYNRRYFFDRATYDLAVSERYGHPLSALIFDIDKFKDVNDKYGHQLGDEILRSIANIAKQRLRESDSIARYGGEEFIIFLPNTDSAKAYIVAEEIRKQVAAYSDAGIARVTISIGIAEVDLEEDTIDRLISRADKALYKAKDTGRNRTVIYSREIA